MQQGVHSEVETDAQALHNVVTHEHLVFACFDQSTGTGVVLKARMMASQAEWVWERSVGMFTAWRRFGPAILLLIPCGGAMESNSQVVFLCSHT